MLPLRYARQWRGASIALLVLVLFLSTCLIAFESKRILPVLALGAVGISTGIALFARDIPNVFTIEIACYAVVISILLYRVLKELKS